MATVTGTFIDPEGNGNMEKVLFKPRSTPIQDSGTVITTKTIELTPAANGAFSILLQEGDYTVRQGPDTYHISVPNAATSHSFVSLLTHGLTYNFTTSPAASIAVATSSVTGTVRVNTDDPGGDPVVYRVGEIDTKYGGIFKAATLAAAKAIASAATNFVLFLAGTAAQADAGAGIFFWDNDGTDGDDSGLTTIRPDDYAAYGNQGNWKRLA
jgi:hypothetical protein